MNICKLGVLVILVFITFSAAAQSSESSTKSGTKMEVKEILTKPAPNPTVLKPVVKKKVSVSEVTPLKINAVVRKEKATESTKKI